MRQSKSENALLLEFFYLMREVGLPVSLREWLTLMEACERGLIGASLTRFYTITRSILIKNEKHYDLFDQCFAHYFADAQAPESLSQLWNSGPRPQIAKPNTQYPGAIIKKNIVQFLKFRSIAQHVPSSLE